MPYVKILSICTQTQDIDNCQYIEEKLEIKRENDQYKIEHEAELQLHLKQKSHYHTNLGKAYTFVFGQCTIGLQHRIEAKAEYKIQDQRQSYKIAGNNQGKFLVIE